MREIFRTSKFKRDFKKYRKSSPAFIESFLEVLELLSADIEIPERYRDHSLSGNWNGFRECHIRPDLLLIYQKTDELLKLVRLGSHSELFSK